MTCRFRPTQRQRDIIAAVVMGIVGVWVAAAAVATFALPFAVIVLIWRWVV